jgi:hypothetical protein
MARLAPRERQASHFSAVPAVVKTRAPKAAASWIAVEEVGPDGEEGFRQRRRLHRVVAAREGQRLGRRHGAILRIAAAIGERADLIAHPIGGDALAERHDLAGDLQAEDGAGIGRRRIVALALQHVRPVDARRRDANEDLAACRMGRMLFHHHQIVRAAVFGEPDIGHGRWHWHGLAPRVFEAWL